jgi:type IV secretion system protein VirD4
MSSEITFESKEAFYGSLSRYKLTTREFKKKNVDSYPYGGDGGVPLAWRADDKTVYIDTSDTHTMIIGATGSKKSRLLVMPTVKILAQAGESMIITDPKAEIYERTAWDLKDKGYKISVVNLRDPLDGDCWNPLWLPYYLYCNGNMDRAYEFANDIATNLMLSEMSHREAYWDTTARDLFFGLTLLLFRLCKKHKLPDAVNITNLIIMKRMIFEEHELDSYSDYMMRHIWDYIEEDAIINARLSPTMGNADSTRKNILCQFDYHMGTFTLSRFLSAMLAENTIDFESIGEEKTAIFLIMPDEKTTYHKLVSLFIKQSYEYLIFKAQTEPNRTMPIRINYVLDEFSSLPKIKDFPSMISAARSRNIRFNLVMQSKNQLKERYESEADTIQANCMNWVFMTSRELQLLKDISELCGTRAGTNKPLVSISELQRFNKEKGEILVIAGRRKPFKGTLPDIDVYDNREYRHTDYPFHKHKKDLSSDKELAKILNGLMKMIHFDETGVVPE